MWVYHNVGYLYIAASTSCWRMVYFKDTLKAFDDFKNKQKSFMKWYFLICKTMSILKVYSIHYILRYNTNVKKFPSDNINGTKNILFFLSRTTTHHSFTFNLRFLYELSRRFVSLKLCAEFTIFDSVSFLLKFMFLFNKMHGLFDFKTS